LQSEINQAGDISVIQFEYNGNSGWTEPIRVYMGHTSKTVFATNTDWVTSSGMTLVYDGSLTVTTTPGWVTITLDTPFSYNNTDNLVIGVDENGSDFHSSSDSFYTKSTPSNYRSIYYNNDVTNPNPASPPTEGSFYYVPSLALSIAAPLPVDLVCFKGENILNNNKLSWSTLSEKNNSSFHIEKSTDGRVFNEIGMLKGSINSIYLNRYQFVDYYLEPTINYYRLKQTDFDGRSSYSKIISIDNRDLNNHEIIGVFNLLGQPVDLTQKGLILIKYKDGTSQKMFNQ